ncbi:winged helix-turn-helix domain-containing protein [Arthrobacter sp. SD76]|uniref:winged helix-turn-helix domain-containing protein n=1 Tax=Arthrobacter sp. SD76 TaxID=3415007 RepID=UPI003C75CA48
METQDPYWSTELTVAAAVYGTAGHIQIIRFLRANGPSTRQDIAQSTGLSHGVAAQCLNRLKSAGVVIFPAEDQAARTYILQTQRAADLFQALETYLNSRLRGQPDQAESAVVLPLRGPSRRRKEHPQSSQK